MNTANETVYELTNNPKIADKEPSDRMTEENFNIQEKLTKPRNTHQSPVQRAAQENSEKNSSCICSSWRITHRIPNKILGADETAENTHRTDEYRH